MFLLVHVLAIRFSSDSNLWLHNAPYHRSRRILVILGPLLGFWAKPTAIGPKFHRANTPPSHTIAWPAEDSLYGTWDRRLGVGQVNGDVGQQGIGGAGYVKASLFPFWPSSWEFNCEKYQQRMASNGSMPNF